MKQEGLVSNYTIAQFQPSVSKSNEDNIENVVSGHFDNQPLLGVVVSDLTYVRVGDKWNYICVLIDLFNCEIIGHSIGPNKDANLVLKAFRSVQTNLHQIRIFHTDRGNEFKNKAIDEVLEVFDIERSLSMKGCPYDNAVAEATYKIIKTEFVKNRWFKNLDELKYEFADYVNGSPGSAKHHPQLLGNGYNNHRIHFSLGYLTPVHYRQNPLKKGV